MTKQLRTMIDAENARRKLQPNQIGALTTYTRGFGLRDDMRIGVVMNAGGGVSGACVANVRAFRKYLAENQTVNGKLIRCYESKPGKNAGWDRWTVAYLHIPARNKNGELFRECVGMSGHSECMLGKHLGRLVMFADLPESLQSIVRADLAE